MRRTSLPSTELGHELAISEKKDQVRSNTMKLLSQANKLTETDVNSLQGHCQNILGGSFNRENWRSPIGEANEQMDERVQKKSSQGENDTFYFAPKSIWMKD